MSTGFLLVETLPGREREVIDLLERFPEVAERQLLFHDNLALRVVAPHDVLGRTIERLRALDGVKTTRFYPVAPAPPVEPAHQTARAVR